ncbi:holo-ACP synthase [Granulicatella sp. zg-ZJ]|uniref:holo-ACP synthase n=1 Tax=unclassified Granulicatella TaxID=2630493 RepID=UPI0013C1DD56|nr:MULTISPECIES: holo-ACP synthase [unclassified Granulicatella]MBS4750120.1 holo-ACP synthase [Carnobacteriaceae bacterium zg-ZUI78]NEW62127.1 holo-ACP synthase [Granulicatella sp. zg-ZJ]NEW66830.1 holo-ACP synthase [Granulicatella sp. zg-84]QMI86230.1 holo-ACP synthase [Carnobacteriaceae bacterium zg-84]
MIKGIGLDIIEIERIQKAYDKNHSFAKKILTEKEYTYFLTLVEYRQMEFLAGRFCAKEAFSKAFGTGIGTLGFHDMEVLPNDKQKPVMTCTKYHGKIFVSITHSNEYAAAQVVLEEEE